EPGDRIGDAGAEPPVLHYRDAAAHLDHGIGGERHLVGIVAVNNEIVGVVRIRAGIGTAPAVPAFDDRSLRRPVAAAVAVRYGHEAEMRGHDRKTVTHLDLGLAP